MAYEVNLKGFSSYSTGYYHQAAAPLIDALEGGGHRVTHIPNHLAVDNFPRGRDELDRYDVVVLSDIPSDTLLLHPATFGQGQRTIDRFRLLAEWVSNGGGLLMVGGYMSFSGFDGKAKYQNTQLASVLPVHMLGYDDRIECPEGVNPVQVEEHDVLSGIAPRWPYFLGYNRFRAKADAQVILSCDNDPFLVLAAQGDGRVGAFASDCTPHWGSPEFLAWPDYGRFWSQLIRWLGGGKS